MTFSMQGLVQFTPKIVDGRSVLSDSVSVTTNLTNGTTSGKANGYWSGTLTIPAADNDTIDLLALSFAAFGLTGTVALASVKYIAMVNESENVTLTVEPGASNGWDQISGFNVGKGGTLVMHSGIDGLPVGGSSKTVKVTNNGTVTTLTGETTTGSGANTITGLSSTSGLSAGMTITGAGIPAGAKIASITSSTALVMTANATASSGSGGVSLDFAWPAAVVKVYIAGILD